MTQEQLNQLSEFEKFSGWMYGDSELALYLAQAQFLVALGLFSYIETLGAFYIGYFQKDLSGNIKTHRCRGCSQCVNGQLKTYSRDRFRRFFSYLGNEYKNLSDTHEEMYKELRCGLSHEFLLSKRPFKIYHAGNDMFTWEQISSNHSLIDLFADNLMNDIDYSIVNCGVVLLKHNGQEIWQVFVPKLAADFRRGVVRFIKEINTGNNQELTKNFFETASQINFDRR